MGDIARAETKKRGLLYFADVLQEVATRLPTFAYAAVAAAASERLLFRHLALPVSDQRPFTVSWRRPLDCMWGVLSGAPDAADLQAEIADALGRFEKSPLNHNDGPDGPDDADHDPAAACIYAAESLVRGMPDRATAAVSRLVDDAFSRVEEQREWKPEWETQTDAFVADCCHPVVQCELRWVNQVMEYVENHPLNSESVAELRRRATSET